MLKVSPPPLYVNGFPKSGLHLVVRMALPFFKAQRPNDIWFGTNAWTTYRIKLDQAVDTLGSIEPGHYLQGHMGHLTELEQLFDALRMLMLFVYRDFRDVIVSQTYHILATEEQGFHHDGRDRYDGMNKEEIMIAAIQGVEDLPGIYDRWETFRPWLDIPFVHAVRFENLIHMPEKEVRRFMDFIYGAAAGRNGLDYVQIDTGYRKSLVEYTVNEMKQRHLSITYRKGKTGQWRYEFTPAVKRAFKDDPINDELLRLKFVRKKDW